VTVDDIVYLIGGCEPSQARCFNDVYRLDAGRSDPGTSAGQAGPPTWSLLDVWADEDDRPAPRGGHVAVRVGAEDVYVHGGADTTQTFSDVYRLNLASRRWTRMESAGAIEKAAEPDSNTSSAGTVAPALSNHAAASAGDGRVYLFGGYDGAKYSDAMWILDVWSARAAGAAGTADATGAVRTAGVQNATSNRDASGRAADGEREVRWAQPARAEAALWPSAREGHTLTHGGFGKLVLIGGYTVGGRTSDEVFVFDSAGKQEWARVRSASGENGEDQDRAAAATPSPGPRQAHSATRHGEEVVLFGGCDASPRGTTCFADVWSLDLRGFAWRRRDVASDGEAGASLVQASSAVRNSAVRAREGHAATAVSGGRMVVVGGCDDSDGDVGECFNDVAVIETREPCGASDAGFAVCGGPDRGRCSTDDTCELSFSA